MEKINPNAKKQRLLLRTIGKVLLLPGVVLVIIGFASFFSSFGSMESPQYFWCAFIGLPMAALGAALLSFGYLGKTSRFIAGETMPVAKDAINYMGKNTKEGVSHFSEAIFSGQKNAEKSELSVEERLKKLDQLHEKGLINEEEYNQQKSRILGDL